MNFAYVNKLLHKNYKMLSDLPYHILRHRMLSVLFIKYVSHSMNGGLSLSFPSAVPATYSEILELFYQQY